MNYLGDDYLIKRLIPYYKPYKTTFFADLAAAFIISLCDFCYPVFTRKILNEFIPEQNIRKIIFAAVFLGIAYLISMGLNYFIIYYGHVVGVNMQKDMRRDVFEHLEKMPFTFFDNNETGKIMSRIINDLQDISELAHHGPEDLFISAVMIIGSFTYLLFINVQLTLIIFAFIPFLVYFSLVMRKKMKKAFMETRKKVAVINSALESSISGIRVTKAFNNFPCESEKFDKGNKEYVKERKYAYKTMAVFHAGTTFITAVLNVAVITAGGIFTYKGIITYGDLTAYMLFINMFTTPIRTFVNFMEQYQNAMTGFKRFTELLDEPVENENENAQSLVCTDGDIKFKNVSFSYNDGEMLLKNVNFNIEKGKTTAIAGHSGGGKTTVCHLIPKFYDISDGDILIDGQSINDVNLKSLRDNIGIVQQDVFLFGGTIKDNILYGKPEATDDELTEAMKKAKIYDFVTALPNGWDTEIGERGVKLSGGQKQRISIARVFLKNPKILILDEATSALDTLTERQIQESLTELSKGRTTIVVAHRLSTIQNADKIIVMDGGVIIEEGTHDELMTKDGYYKKLVQPD